MGLYEKIFLFFIFLLGCCIRSLIVVQLNAMNALFGEISAIISTIKNESEKLGDKSFREKVGLPTNTFTQAVYQFVMAYAFFLTSVV